MNRQADRRGQRPLEVGERVVVRYRLEPGEPGRPTVSDALGELVEVRADAVVVQTRRGPVTIARDDVLLAKRVPPPPPGRAAGRPVDPPPPLQ